MNKIIKFFITVILIGSAVTIYWYLYEKPFIGIDDSNIYFVYAKNLANNHGLVYNVGGERVEGFTSILWLLIISIFYKLSNNYEMLLMFFSYILIAITLFRCIVLVDRINNYKGIFSINTYIFLSTTILLPGYLDWTVLTLMETGFWSFLLVLFIVIISNGIIINNIKKYNWIYGLLSSMLVLTRPESLLWVPVIILMIFILGLINGYSIKEALKIVLPSILLSVLTLTTLTVFRLVYFGYPLPNTYYAKVSSDTLYNILQGLKYFIRSCIKSPHIFIIASLSITSAVFLFLKIRDDFMEFKKVHLSIPEQIQLLLTMVSLISLAIPVLTGGDHFNLARFYQPFFPIYLLSLLNISFWKNIVIINVSIDFTMYRVYGISLLIIFLYLTPKIPLHDYIDIKSSIDHEFRLAELGRENGEFLNTLFDSVSKPDVGVSAAGGFAYSYQGKTIDFMGLNDIAMAHAVSNKRGVKNHAAFDSKTFFKHKPEIFHGYKKVSFFIENDSIPPLLEDSGSSSYTFVNNMYKGLFDNPQFINTYYPVFVVNNNLCYTTYMHVNYIKKLRKKNIDVRIRPSKKRSSKKF